MPITEGAPLSIADVTPQTATYHSHCICMNDKKAPKARKRRIAVYRGDGRPVAASQFNLINTRRCRREVRRITRLEKKRKQKNKYYAVAVAGVLSPFLDEAIQTPTILQRNDAARRRDIFSAPRRVAALRLSDDEMRQCGV